MAACNEDANSEDAAAATVGRDDSNDDYAASDDAVAAADAARIDAIFPMLVVRYRDYNRTLHKVLRDLVAVAQLPMMLKGN